MKKNTFINRENFILKKVKELKGAGLSITYEAKELSNGNEIITEHRVKDCRMPCGDLYDAMDAMTNIVLKMTIHRLFFDGLMSDSVNMNKEQGDKVISLYDVVKGRVKVTGITIDAKDEFSVNAEINNGFATMNVTTPSFPIESNVNFDVVDIRDLIKRIEDEAYDYIFMGKTEEMAIFG